MENGNKHLKQKCVMLEVSSSTASFGLPIIGHLEMTHLILVCMLSTDFGICASSVRLLQLGEKHTKGNCS